MADPKGHREAGRASALGMLVRRLRRERRLTLAELAKGIPMSASNLSRLELGSQRPPPDEVIERIARALRVEADPLLTAAGRHPGDREFEEAVIRRLDAISRDVREVKEEVKRDGR